ncbi:SusD/RagB family nutrient-binding outer membrane lipoprotein [Hymenobacter busanensis]|uniref:SusD/RagB family nutrient-binding outer membrane lipoprotein n=1 Tax=Hymenobacter busanensis TaxID=2607656 RepID=A0A7L5A1V6_9BACT|nr:SusD/RagB family nutrient-binding outer membrane lipoprotein [Hymenobacter busanensis]KAA9338309.1 SusD/RagB family nutrient-binding outer membrane lipoprotein [Hymenobacter busanensis]QHJ09267.1 SusD/RagB family nutrient-binding outer membrane lipoprotein [Hymenobacter busanensis]
MSAFNYRKLAFALPLVLGLASCDKGFEGLNKNPNNPETANPAYVLTNAERQNIFRLFDVPAAQDGSQLIVQHWAKVQYTNEDRYSFRPASYQSIWDGFYSQGLQDFNDIIRQGKAQNNPNYQAVGMIMRTYFFSVLTDIYGDIPYSEAGRLADNIITPKYDKQEDIYTGMIAELKTASALINTSGADISGDEIYFGDMAAWKKFANSLRLRLAMRIADANSTLSQSAAAEALAAGVFTSNADNAQFNFLPASPNNNPVNENRKTRDDHRVSRTLVQRLLKLNDPRIAVYANHPECGDASAPYGDSTNTYRGVRNGLTNAQATGLGPFCATSKVGDYFTAGDAPGVLMTYAEVLFFKAEALARGTYGITGDATTEYKNAITASMEQYGISAADIATYLAQPAVNVTVTGTNFKQAIGEQKWIALFGQGNEAWSEYRRLDYPVLPLPRNPVAAAGGKIPVRFPYPANEQSVNQASYAAAVARQGADGLTTKLWWDKN